jgi:hypothetical protein
MKLASFFSGGIVPGTVRANKAVVAGANKGVDTLDVATLKIGGTALVPSGAAINLAAQGVAAGYKVARGVHQQAAAADTVVTGLATVVSVVACFRDAPTLKQMFVHASIGNQAGAPAAGSILITVKKPTAVDDVTPTAATDFTDNISYDWIAVGT